MQFLINMNKILEDLLCGGVGFAAGSALGKRNISRADCEEITKSWLRNTSLEDVISAWIEDGEHDASISSIIFDLEEIIQDLKYMNDEY